MKLLLDANAFIGYFFDKNFRKLIDDKYPGITEGRIGLCISPLILEEFFYNLISTPRGILKKLTSNKTDREDRIRHFFKNYGSEFILALDSIESLDIPSRTNAILGGEELLISLTPFGKNLGTMDIVHFSTAIFHELEGIITEDNAFYNWFKKNKDLRKIKDALPKNFEFILVDVKKKEIEIERI